MIIGVSGYAGAGKDTVGAYLQKCGWIRVAFADKLKELAIELDPELYMAWGDWLSLSYLIEERGSLDAAKQVHAPVRQYLQGLGVAMRDVLWPDIWVDAAMTTVHGETEQGHNVVITDVRFPNELQAIRELGGEVWRVNRRDHHPVNGHMSETALDSAVFDLVLENNHTIEDLERSILGYLQMDLVTWAGDGT